MKTYRFFKVAKQAREELPQYLADKYGDKPAVGFKLNMNLVIELTLKLTFSPEFLSQNPDLEEKLAADVLEKYPLFKKCRFRVLVVDSSMSKIDILKKYYPKVYAKFGKMIEKKLKEKEAAEVHEEPTD